MKRSNSEQVGDILRQALRENGLETPLNQYRLMESWKGVVGEGIASYSGEMFIKNQTLYVKIRSSVVKNELMMIRTSLVKRLNDAVGAVVIAEIIFM